MFTGSYSSNMGHSRSWRLVDVIFPFNKYTSLDIPLHDYSRVESLSPQWAGLRVGTQGSGVKCWFGMV